VFCALWNAPRRSRRRECHILSPAATRARAPRAPTLTRTPYEVRTRAGDARRAPWSLEAPACGRPQSPPCATGGSRRPCIRVLGGLRNHLPGASAASRWRKLQAQAAGRGGWLGLGASARLLSAPRRAPHCSGQRGGGAGDADCWRASYPEPLVWRRIRAAEPRLRRAPLGAPRAPSARLWVFSPSPIPSSSSLWARAHLAGGRRAVGSCTASSRRPRPAAVPADERRRGAQAPR
jgi:hypothetical protein